MATRNANDGISMAQTAEGALDQVANNLQRINELAIQSANGTYNDAAREGLQQEVDELTQEINRIVETTEFNGQKLLSRDASALTLQIGFHDDENSRISTGLEGGLAAADKGGKFTFADSPKTFEQETMAQSVGQLELGRSLLHEDATNGLDTVLAGQTIAWGDTAITDLADATNGTETSQNLAEEIGRLGNGQSVTIDGMTLTRQTQDSADDYGQQLKIEFNGKETTVDGVWDAADGALNNAAVISEANMQDLFGNNLAAGEVSPSAPLAGEYFGTNGGVAAVTYADTALSEFKVDSEGMLDTMRSGDTVELDGFTYRRGSGGDADKLYISSEYGAGLVEIPAVFNADGDVLGADNTQNFTAAQYDTLLGNVAQETGNLGTLLNGDLEGTKVIDISTAESAQAAIDFTRESIDLISEIRATFGAVMNRFDAVISGNNIYSENLSAARSRIQDADFAQESSNLAKQQVLQQAGIASLSQANASSQAILSLLG
jgi:flagellin